MEDKLFVPDIDQIKKNIEETKDIAFELRCKACDSLKVIEKDSTRYKCANCLTIWNKV